MWIIERAVRLVEAVATLKQRVRAFFYEVVLAEHPCPRCGGRLAMQRESWCQCTDCGYELDPTVMWQRCSSCGGVPRLRVLRYQCASCGRDVASRFVFDGLAFDAAYFRQKMTESRQRTRELRERVRQMLLEGRSARLPIEPAEPSAAIGLFGALNGLMQEPAADWPRPESRSRFDLSRYQAHVHAHLRPNAVSLTEIPPLSKNARLDRVWRFIAIIFLAHAGELNVWQAGPDIMVSTRETDPEGQGVPGDAEEADGVEGSVGRAEA